MCIQFNVLHLILYFSLVYMQFNGLNLIQMYIIFIFMQFNVHNLTLIYTIFIYILIHCLSFLSFLTYIIIFALYAYTCIIQLLWLQSAIKLFIVLSLFDKIVEFRRTALA